MSDLIERLRNAQDEINSPGEDAALHLEAADEIERLRLAHDHRHQMMKEQEAEIERLKAVVDAVTKVTDRAAHDRSYDGNLIEDIRDALEKDDDPV